MTGYKTKLSPRMQVLGVILFSNAAGIPDANRNQRAFGKITVVPPPMLRDTVALNPSHIVQHENNSSASETLPTSRSNCNGFALTSPDPITRHVLLLLPPCPQPRTSPMVPGPAPWSQPAMLPWPELPSQKPDCWGMRGLLCCRQTSEGFIKLLNLSPHVKSPARSI